ncbi:MAG: oxidoreductase domain protein [Marmoricola sp.]|nr:oxidoreductase domain protein [Marmoricola sp.]
MAKPLRVGLIGTGMIGRVHAHAIRSSGGRLTRVAASTPERSADAARRLGAEGPAASGEALIASDDVDVVHICTPNAMHHALAEQAIAAGKPVVCEKPLATSVEDAERLVALARTAGVVTAVPFVYRYYPTVQETRALITNGDAGRLSLLHGSYLQDWLAGGGATNWRVDPEQGGGSRAFGDIGVHWCDLMEFATGHRITRLMARLSRAYDQRPTSEGMASVGTEDAATVMFETDQGATGSLVASQVSLGRKNKLWFSFDGTEASFVFDQEQPDSLWIGGATQSRMVPRGPDTLGSEQGRGYSVLPAGHPQGYQDCFNAFVADVYATLEGQARAGLPTFTDGLRAAVLTEAVLHSAKNDSWIEVPACRSDS